ncbi:hypothetical protein UA08_03868 [Talaromyces atroroseus]|uniref:Uncharacterized protein n=1 Tax=Talaromyces atroroseus TaxID=1441469 RepID=A0A225AL57_TALAT|nr:hypothetical protein UA08_03868 [Talaromyces atroroseus]OKL61630.1 hypothetical protein UA08_03868 [Talaromyces atroroseus]
MSSNPDLSSVLRTLSAFAKPASSTSPAGPGPSTHNQHQRQQPPSSKTYERKPPTPPSTDPSSITTWPSALKHIMHLVSTNASFAANIQHLIKSQREHERQWWSGREALIAKQRTREEKRKKVEEVLKSVGAPVNTPSNPSLGMGSSHKDSKEVISRENATELLTYDTKVYQASVDLSRSMETELRKLGVPFFCLNGALTTGSITPASSASSKEKDKEKGLPEDELDLLKRRVLDLLVDLCTD